MNAQPTFSIITVTWNAAAELPPTLKSIGEQSCHDFEYLVIDGASTDDTLPIINRAAIPTTRIISEPDGGLYDAMNKAILRAQGRYLIWMNAGDAFATPDSLTRIAECAKANPGVIYGQTQLVDEARQVIGMRHLSAPKQLTWQSFKHGMLVCHQAFVARRDICPQYNLDYRYSADYDWCIRVLQASSANAYVGSEPIISFLQAQGLTVRHHRDSLKERYHIMCHYYGTVPTALRHVGFALRTLRRKITRQ